MLEEVLVGTARICIDCIRLPSIKEWDQAVKAVKGSDATLEIPGCGLLAYGDEGRIRTGG